MSYSFSSPAATLCFAAALLTILVACIVVVKDRRSFASRSLISCLGLLALVQFFRGMGFQAETADKVIYWEQVRTAFAALQPGAFLIFSLVFARLEYRKYIARWKYVLAAVFTIPLLTLVAPSITFFQYLRPINSLSQPILPLGFSGKIYYAVFLISAVLILANLEYTLRASTGRIRWQIKFIILGIGSICAVWIYTSSQALVYLAVDTSISVVHAAAILIANLLFLWGLVRSQFLNVDVYLSRTTIQYSLTTILASIYLISIGILAYYVRFSDQQFSLPVTALVVLFALAALAVLLLSNRLHERIRRFVTKHFKRPVYDYRKIWMDLTEKTNTLVDIHDLCTAVSRIISHTFGILSVNIWICDEAKERLTLAGSTVFTPAQSMELERKGSTVADLLKAFEGKNATLDLKDTSFDWANEVMRARPEYFAENKMRYVHPLTTGGLLVGIITLNGDRVGRAPFSSEDQDLLHAYAAQLAARVLQLRLSEALRQAQEIEAFQNVSAFFVHDLKNLASRLSLTMQNLPVYFDNAEFRGDALKLIGESLAKIDEICERLSSLKQKIELNKEEEDLNRILAGMLDDFERGMKIAVNRDLQPLPPIPLDREQLQKVLNNLIMNAYEASKGEKGIRAATSVRDGQIILSITDAGCGISQEFLDKSLFKPFRSTKKRGMGIGLFHSKMIVEAHHGKIEVESEEGKGTTFRVVLPLN
jgi:putative PEP-CTERM system histidine kinase